MPTTRCLAALSSLLICSPVLAQMGNSNAGGAPSAYFAGNREIVAERLKAQCASAGRDVDRADDREVVCSRELRGLQGAWAKFGSGRAAYDDRSKQRILFTLLGSGGNVLVRASLNVGTNPKQQNWTPKAIAEVRFILDEAGGSATPEEAATMSQVAPRTVGPLVVPQPSN